MTRLKVKVASSLKSLLARLKRQEEEERGRGEEAVAMETEEAESEEGQSLRR